MYFRKFVPIALVLVKNLTQGIESGHGDHLAVPGVADQSQDDLDNAEVDYPVGTPIFFYPHQVLDHCHEVKENLAAYRVVVALWLVDHAFEELVHQHRPLEDPQRAILPGADKRGND